MRQREKKRVRLLYAKPTAKLSRRGLSRLPQDAADLVARFAAEQAMPQCVMDVLPQLGARKYEVSCDGGEIRIKLHHNEIAKLLGQRLEITEMTHGTSTVIVRGSEEECDVFGQELVLDYLTGSPGLPREERRVWSKNLRSHTLVLTAGERDRDFLRAWYSRYLRVWPRTGGRTILERFVQIPWRRGCDRCAGGGCPRDAV